MARIKLSEFRAKNLLYDGFGVSYDGLEVKLGDYSDSLFDQLEGPYAVKVDQAIKKRNTLGLVRVNRSRQEALADLMDYQAQGFRYALVEKSLPHQDSEELFVALEQTDQGIEFHFSSVGGVHVEDNKDSVMHYSFDLEGQPLATMPTGVSTEVVKGLLDCFIKNYMTYLEINPLLVRGDMPVFLDAAVEVDSTARFFVDGWTLDDERVYKKTPQAAETAVEQLAAKSAAALSLKVLNPDGAAFLLLSGGGASLVVADELAAASPHDLSLIANYGEYSGNPNQQETYAYTKQIIQLLLDSKAPKKVLIIAGGVANFTDVSSTFGGIIKALQDSKGELQKQDMCILVRRGGPNQAAGLQAMRTFLSESGLKNEVHGPEISFSEIVRKAADFLMVPA